MARIIAVTGGIGSGKSTVARMLCDMYAGVHVSADALVHQMFANPVHPVCTEIRAAFGDAAVTAAGVDRVYLGTVVFEDPKARKQLESIVHPAVRQEMAQAIQAGTQDHDLVVVEVPLLFESHMEAMFPEIWLVCSDENLRLQRVQERDGLGAEAIQARMAAQMPDSAKADGAHVVIENSGDTAALQQAVEKHFSA